jgi:N-acetylglucosaminyl-diphospho-decaprenol L-rhamnosyltransferase
MEGVGEVSSYEPVHHLAVVIVNYNAGEYLTRCVGSIYRRSGGLSVDVLVVDNASRDGSARAARRAHPAIRLIENSSNRGLSAAWNQGAALTDAPWICFLNPDTELWAGDLAAFVGAGEARPDVALLGPMIRNPDGSIYESGRGFPSVGQAIGHAFLGPVRPSNRFTRAYRQADWDRRSEREVEWVSGACLLLRRKVFDEIGRFDESFWLYGEELDLCTRLRDAGWKVLYDPRLEIVHEGGVSTGRSRATHLQHSASIYRYYRKHRARGWRRITLPFARAALRTRAELAVARDRAARR